MKIAVNTRLLLKGRLEGIGWFTYQTLRRITEAHPEHEFIFIFDRKYDNDFIFSKNVTPVVVSPPARHPVLWLIWFEWSVKRVLRKHKPDLFLSTDGHLSLSTKTPSVAVIHDINFHHRPEDLPFWNRLYYRYFFPRFARKSIILGTVSEYSRDDLIKSYHIKIRKIRVIYNGAHALYQALGEDNKIAVRAEYTGGMPYFIFVGALHPRKNLINLLKSFDLFRKDKEGYKLVIVGEKMFGNSDILKVHKNMCYKEDVIFTGRMGPEKLHLLMGSSEALVFIPFFEGFGIPLVEAMYCEIPILASHVTSIPEIAGNAALYTSTDDIHEIAAGMHRIIEDSQLRNRLIQAGRERRVLYSWDHAAEILWEMIEDTFKMSKDA